LFEAEAPDDERPRALIARTRASARGELNTAEEIRRRFVGGVPITDVAVPAAAAAYAVRAAILAAPDRPEVVDDEIRWQLTHMTAEVRAALSRLPPVGENPSGPLGPGLLASGQLGTILRALQAGIAGPD
jgi:hypothetical protein